MTATAETHVTLDDVLDDIKAYAADPTHELLKDILTAISTLDTLIDQEKALRAVEQEKSKHNLTYTCIEETGCGPSCAKPTHPMSFSMMGSSYRGAVCDALEDSGHYLTLPTDNLLRGVPERLSIARTLPAKQRKTIDGWLGAATRPDRIRSALELLEIATKTDVDKTHRLHKCQERTFMFRIVGVIRPHA